jgi:hypothetical protein
MFRFNAKIKHLAQFVLFQNVGKQKQKCTKRHKNVTKNLKIKSFLKFKI